MNKCPEFHFTPPDIAKELIKDIKFNEDDNTLEPCKASGNFYDLIPYKKDWCEIDEGRDIFTYDFGNTKFTKVIVNPPYRTNHADEKERKNIVIDFIFKCFDLCDGEVWILLNGKMLNSITPIRLQKIKEKGFNMCFMRILNIKIWYGRYYWVCFSNKKESIITF
tara:strand:+ start:337 stop:831 length:495 start_codon:yes stop_codon:yes gene_type:complete